MQLKWECSREMTLQAKESIIVLQMLLLCSLVGSTENSIFVIPRIFTLYPTEAQEHVRTLLCCQETEGHP